MPETRVDNNAFIDEVVASGHFANRDAAIDEAVHLLREQIQQNGRTPQNELTADEWCERLDAWAASHRALSHEADDTCERIYAGCGERMFSNNQQMR